MHKVIQAQNCIWLCIKLAINLAFSFYFESGISNSFLLKDCLISQAPKCYFIIGHLFLDVFVGSATKN